MPVDDNERSMRRRVVFHAMNGNATPKAIQYAINMLETDFANDEKLRYNELIQRMQADLDSAEANLGKVLGKIMSIRSLPADQIGPDPLGGASETGSSAERQAPTAPVDEIPSVESKHRPKRTGAHHVFSTVIEMVVSHLQHRGDDSHLQLIDAILSSRDIQKSGSRLVEPFQNFRSSPQSGNLLINGTQDEYRMIVHRAYVWLCEKLGPVDADRTLNAAIRSADSLPEAVNHSPRELL